MTKKQFIIKNSTITDGYCIFDTEKKYAFVPVEKKEQLMSTVKVLNKLNEENKRLKSDLTHLKVLYHSLQDKYSGLLRLVHGFDKKMIYKRFLTNEVGCIVDLKDEQLRNYDGEEIVDLLNELSEENEHLKAQLFCNSDGGVCTICTNHYLVQREDGYYISKCKEGHRKCSTEPVKYCSDFILKKR